MLVFSAVRFIMLYLNLAHQTNTVLPLFRNQLLPGLKEDRIKPGIIRKNCLPVFLLS